jgi:large subunit ribosomal protein L30
MKPNTKKTLELLKLERPNHCVVYAVTPQIAGMVNIAKDYVAYGPIKQETLEALLAKRGEKGAKSLVEVLKPEQIKAAAKEIFGGKKLAEFADPVFRLHPPRSGYKDIKLSYPQGDLGKRDDMDDLLKRMM